MSDLFTTVDVGQFGPDDSNIDRYKQAGEYALESKLYAYKTKELYDQLKNDVFITDSVLAAETAAAQATVSSDEAQEAAQEAKDAALSAATDATTEITQQLQDQKDEFEADQSQRETEYNDVLTNLIPLGKQYTTVAEAQAAITAGTIPLNGFFWVRSAESTTLAYEYTNTAGLAQPTGKTMVSQERVDNLLATAGLVVSQPNLFSNDVSDSKVLPPYGSYTSLPVLTSKNGVPCIRISTLSGSTTEAGIQLGRFDESKFPSGFISGSINVVSLDASTGTASQLRIVIQQFDASGVEILSDRQFVQIATTGAMTGPRFGNISGIVKNPLCKSVVLFVGLTTGDASTVRNVWFRDINLSDGMDPVFRRNTLNEATVSESISGTSSSVYMSPSVASRTSDQRFLSTMGKNLIFPATFESFSEGSVPTGWINTTVAIKNDTFCLKTPAATIATAINGPIIDVSSLQGKHFSYSLDIIEKIGDQGVLANGLNNLRLRLQALDSSGNPLPAAWIGYPSNDDNTITGNQYYTRNIPRDSITEPYRVNIARNLLVPVGAASIQVLMRVENNGSTPAPSVYLTNLVFMNAPDAIMSPTKLSGDAVFPGKNTSNWITEKMAYQVAQGKSFWNDVPNWFTDSQLKSLSAGSTVPNWQLSPKAVMKNGYLTLEQPAANTVSAVGSSHVPGFDVSAEKFPSGKFSAAVDIIEKIGDQGVLANGLNNIRVRLIAVDASGALIQTAWIGYPSNDDNTITGNQYYTRNVPRSNVTTRTRVVIAEGLTIPAGAVRIQFNIRSEGFAGAPCPQVYYTNWTLRNGDDSSWIPEQSSGSGSTSATPTVYVSPTGSNTNSGLTVDSPMKTVAAAVDKLSGVGRIFVASGDWNIADFQVPFANIKDIKIEGVTTNAFKYPTVRGGTLLSGITKTSGRSRIYQAALTGFAAGTHPSWLWIDNLPDADTLELPENYFPAMRGRANRLECTKIWICDTVRNAINGSPATTWTLDSALVEMDSSDSPRFVWDQASGTVYFTIPNGGDATSITNGIYAVVTNQRVFSGAGNQFATSGNISITGVHFRYASLDTWAFRETDLKDVTVLGASENCFEIGNWTRATQCKAAGSGSTNFLGTFDGFNMHNFSVFAHYGCWATDCLDDGWSSHENCTEYGISPTATYNLGSGLTPAYGAECYYLDPFTRKNALQLRKLNVKRAGIESHQGPIATDPGVSTVVMVRGGYSEGDYNGYISGDTGGSPNASTLTAINCSAVDSVQFGFRCTKIVDCSYGGTTGTAKHSNTKKVISTTRISS